MTRFADERAAKEFLVSAIVAESKREGVALSEIERKMLYFSESGWTLPDMEAVNQAFDREYDCASYEKKIEQLARKLQNRLQSHDKETFEQWSDAIHRLEQGDHYVLVMIPDATELHRPAGDLLKLFMTALVIVFIALAFAELLSTYFQEPPTREAISFVFWVVSLGFVCLFLLLSLLIGRERVTGLLVVCIDRIFGDRRRRRD